MRRLLSPALWCAASALFILPVSADGNSSSSAATSTPTVEASGFTLVDALAMVLAAAILCGIIFLFYRVLQPKSQSSDRRRLKRR